MAPPSIYPEWNKTEVNNVEADTQHKDEGWIAPGGVPEKPPFQTFNWWQNLVYKWIKYLTETRVDTIAAMEARTSPSTGEVVFVKDLDRGGTFIYDSTLIASDDQGTNFNGWIRQFDGPVNVKWFGAVGDGVADDTDAFQRAGQFISTNGVSMPDGEFLVTDTMATVNDSNPIILHGSGQNVTKIIFKPILATTPFLNSATGVSYSKISKFAIEGDTGLASGSRKGIFINADTIFVRSMIEEIEFSYLDIGFNLPGDTFSNYYRNVKGNVTRIGWYHPTRFDEVPPSGGNVAMNNTTFDNCRFRADDRGILVNAGMVNVTFFECIWDNRVGDSLSYSAEFIFPATVSIIGGYNEPNNRDTFKISFPPGRGYLGQLDIRGLWSKDSGAISKNNTLFLLSGYLNVNIEKCFFNNFDIAVKNELIDGILNYSNNSFANLNTEIDSTGSATTEVYTDGAETGNDANGYWIKYPSGWVIQTHTIDVDQTIDTASFGGFKSAATAWNYPIPMVSARAGSAEIYADSAFGVNMSIENTAASVIFTAVTTQTTALRRAKVMVTGRWK